MFSFELLNAVAAAVKCRTVLDMPLLLGIDSGSDEMVHEIRNACEQLHVATSRQLNGQPLISEQQRQRFQDLYIAASRDTGPRPMQENGDPAMRETLGPLQQAVNAINDEIFRLAGDAIRDGAK